MAEVLALVSVFTILTLANGFAIPNDHLASVENFPYIVSLQESDTHFCNGIILNCKYILTAASCFDSIEIFDLQFMRVVAGSEHPIDGGVKSKVAGFFIHPQHVNLNVTFDVAVVELEEELEFTSKIAPASLVDETADIPAGTLVNITGYGLNRADFAPKVLKYAEVEIIEQEECQKFWPTRANNEQLICAGNSDDDVGYGDAGSPMTLNGKLIGYASLLSMNDGSPSLFTKISSIRSWIKENTGV